MTVQPLADLIQARKGNRALQGLPLPKYMLAVTIDANTLDELQSAVEQFAVDMAVDWLNREQIDATSGRVGVRLEVVDAEQTPERWSEAILAWSADRRSPDSGLEATVAEHEIVWKLEDGNVVAELVCNDPACEFAWTCPEGCPVLTDQEKTESGYRHRAHESFSGLADVWHAMEPAECNFATWLNDDRYMIPELNESTTVFEIGRTAVEPVWMGEDGTNWMRPEDRNIPDSGSTEEKNDD